jgi:hypothetical protein
MIDGRPLLIGGSKDRQAGSGQAAGGKTKGYKPHALVGSDGTVAQGPDGALSGELRQIASYPGYLVMLLNAGQCPQSARQTH